MISRTENGSLRVAEIPAEIRAAERYQHRRDNYYSRAECNKQPVKCRSSRNFSSRELQVYHIELFAYRFQFVRFLLCDILAEQCTHGSFERFRQRYEHIRIGNGQPLLPFGHGLPHDIQLDREPSCESPFDFLIVLMFSLSIGITAFLSVVTDIVSPTARCRKQRRLTYRFFAL